MHASWDRAADVRGGRIAANRLAVVAVHAARDALAAERDRWALWLPVFLGAGIAFYFSLQNEPPWWIAAAALSAAAMGAVALRRHLGPVLFLIVMATVAVGFGRAQLQTWLVAAPVLQKRTGPVSVEGRVLRISPHRDGWRLLLGDVSVRGLASGRTPAHVRVRVVGAVDLESGDTVGLRAILMPPPRPAAPGAFDFARRAYFQRLGAVGFAVGTPRILAKGSNAGGFAASLARLRRHITDRVLSAMPSPEGAVAAALMTGERGAIPEEMLVAMRDSGLAHLLAISGLHIGLVAGILFFGLRLLLACWERLALRYPIKKWAAFGSLAGAFGYLLISGATVPTQRAFLMTAIVILGVFCDRTAISMRLVAWAAAAVLLLRPESLLSASFQLSFAAVVALVAAYELGAPMLSAMRRGGGFGRKAGLYIAGILLTTIVAGMATAPFAAFHFNRFAAYGVAANVLAIPLTGFWIMPWAVMAFVLMPLGLENLALTPMGWGIQGLLDVARMVAAWPGASLPVPAAPTEALALVSAGGLWLCLWRTRWRVLGLAAVAVGVMSFGIGQPPDVLVGREGDMLAVRLDDGRYASLGRSKVVRDVWQRRNGGSAFADWPRWGYADGGTLACGPSGCLFESKGRRVAVAWERGALDEDCQSVDAVLALVPIRRRNCTFPSALIRPYDLYRFGAHALWLTANGVKVESVAETSGHRPWTRGWRRGRDRFRARRVSRAASGRRAALAP